MKMILITFAINFFAFVVIYVTIYADTVSKNRKKQQQKLNSNDHKL